MEVWQGSELVGGLYGLRIERFFAGEAMFHTATDASKAALVALVDWLISTGAELLDLFDSQATSRHLDFESRKMRARNESFYTIGSSGHEGNAVVGLLTRPTDPAFLHYRSGALMMARARKDPTVDPILDTLLSFVASSDDPISGGRHKVWGSRALWVPPQTSTIASHLPKAVGAAFALARARRVLPGAGDR